MVNYEQHGLLVSLVPRLLGLLEKTTELAQLVVGEAGEIHWWGCPRLDWLAVGAGKLFPLHEQTVDLGDRLAGDRPGLPVGLADQLLPDLHALAALVHLDDLDYLISDN